MTIEKRIAQEHDLAYYADGTIVHVGLCVGMNKGVDANGFDHRAEYEKRKDQGQYPTRFNGIRMSAVTEHMRNNARVVAHWRALAEDVQRVMHNHETDFHRMAKEACLELVQLGHFQELTRYNMRKFHVGNAQIEHPITAGDTTYYADVGVWDNRFPQFPIAMEITFTSGQSDKRLNDMIKAGVKVYEANIYNHTLQAAKDGVKIDHQFYKDYLMRRGFREQSSKDRRTLLDVEIIRLDELLRQKKLQREMEIASKARMMAPNGFGGLRKMDADEREQFRATEDARLALLDHHAECYQCKHRYPCAYFLSSKCGPQYEFECV
jgi:hypothetical protein